MEHYATNKSKLNYDYYVYKSIGNLNSFFNDFKTFVSEQSNIKKLIDINSTINSKKLTNIIDYLRQNNIDTITIDNFIELIKLKPEDIKYIFEKAEYNKCELNTSDILVRTGDYFIDNVNGFINIKQYNDTIFLCSYNSNTANKSIFVSYPNKKLVGFSYKNFDINNIPNKELIVERQKLYYLITTALLGFNTNEHKIFRNSNGMPFSGMYLDNYPNEEDLLLNPINSLGQEIIKFFLQKYSFENNDLDFIIYPDYFHIYINEIVVLKSSNLNSYQIKFNDGIECNLLINSIIALLKQKSTKNTNRIQQIGKGRYLYKKSKGKNSKGKNSKGKNSKGKNSKKSKI
jgi:hypothetical protein